MILRAPAILFAAALLACPLGAGAEEACKPTQLKNPALKLAEVYTIASGHAKAWKADAVPARVGNTSLGPLQPDGSSIAWNLMFYSESAKASMSVTTFRGTLSCWAQPGPAGRIPDLKPDFLRDGAKLYALGKQNGEALLAQGYFIMIDTAAAPGTRHATWYINYSNKDNQSGKLSVIVDANTGAVENVLK
jgi:hypothetical protein